MVVSRRSADPVPIEIRYAPQLGHELLPVEVLQRSEVVQRVPGTELASRQRPGFHLLIVCTAGGGTHVVDYDPVRLSAGTVLRVHPGQVQQFRPEASFEAVMVVWPVDSHPADPAAPAWYPGSGVPTCWQVEGDLLTRILGWIEELRTEQDRFDGSPRHVALMKALLSSLLLRLAIELPDQLPGRGPLPDAYVGYRQLIEELLFERPTVAGLSTHLGYSARTLDRACKQVSGQTAKQVLDERIALEIRRLLTHSDRPVGRIAADLGFDDPSNFSKFVRRHLGRLPSQIRDDLVPPATG